MLEPLAALGRFVYVCFDQSFPPGPEKPFPNGSFTEADMYKQPKKHVGAGGDTTNYQNQFSEQIWLKTCLPAIQIGFRAIVSFC